MYHVTFFPFLLRTLWSVVLIVNTYRYLRRYAVQELKAER